MNNLCAKWAIAILGFCGLSNSCSKVGELKGQDSATVPMVKPEVSPIVKKTVFPKVDGISGDISSKKSEPTPMFRSAELKSMRRDSFGKNFALFGVDAQDVTQLFGTAAESASCQKVLNLEEIAFDLKRAFKLKNPSPMSIIELPISNLSEGKNSICLWGKYSPSSAAVVKKQFEYVLDTTSPIIQLSKFEQISNLEGKVDLEVDDASSTEFTYSVSRTNGEFDWQPWISFAKSSNKVTLLPIGKVDFELCIKARDVFMNEGLPVCSGEKRLKYSEKLLPVLRILSGKSYSIAIRNVFGEEYRAADAKIDFFRFCYSVSPSCTNWSEAIPITEFKDFIIEGADGRYNVKVVGVAKQGGSITDFPESASSFFVSKDTVPPNLDIMLANKSIHDLSTGQFGFFRSHFKLTAGAIPANLKEARVKLVDPNLQCLLTSADKVEISKFSNGDGDRRQIILPELLNDTILRMNRAKVCLQFLNHLGNAQALEFVVSLTDFVQVMGPNPKTQISGNSFIIKVQAPIESWFEFNPSEYYSSILPSLVEPISSLPGIAQYSFTIPIYGSLEVDVSASQQLNSVTSFGHSIKYETKNQYSWKPINNLPRSIPGIEGVPHFSKIIPFSKDRIFLWSDSKALFETLNGGVSWAIVKHDLGVPVVKDALESALNQHQFASLSQYTFDELQVFQAPGSFDKVIHLRRGQTSYFLSRTSTSWRKVLSPCKFGGGNAHLIDLNTMAAVCKDSNESYSSGSMHVSRNQGASWETPKQIFATPLSAFLRSIGSRYRTSQGDKVCSLDDPLKFESSTLDKNKISFRIKTYHRCAFEGKVYGDSTELNWASESIPATGELTSLTKSFYNNGERDLQYYRNVFSGYRTGIWDSVTTLAKMQINGFYTTEKQRIGVLEGDSFGAGIWLAKNFFTDGVSFFRVVDSPSQNSSDISAVSFQRAFVPQKECNDDSCHLAPGTVAGLSEGVVWRLFGSVISDSDVTLYYSSLSVLTKNY